MLKALLRHLMLGHADRLIELEPAGPHADLLIYQCELCSRVSTLHLPHDRRLQATLRTS